MVEPAGIEPASATFNCRDSFTSLAGFWLQQAHLKKCLLLKGVSETSSQSQATFCLLAVAASRVVRFL